MVRCTLLKESYYNTFLSLQITFIQLLIVLHVIKTLYVIVNNSFFFFFFGKMVLTRVMTQGGKVGNDI